MKLTVRLTHAFSEIKTDETDTTVYHLNEIEEMIKNLLNVIDDLNKLKELKFKLETRQQTALQPNTR